MPHYLDFKREQIRRCSLQSYQNSLRQLLKEHHMSQSQLASIVGVSQNAISGYANGLYLPSLEVAFKIACVFDVDPRFIFCHNDRYIISWCEDETCAEGYDRPSFYERKYLKFSEAEFLYKELLSTVGVYNVRISRSYYDCTGDFYHKCVDDELPF